MTGSEVWRRGWFWLLLALASTLPFIIAPLPMMPDYFSHMARYHVMNHGAESPFLPRYYAFHWALIGNLGVDLIMVPLGQVLPTETAARLAAALIPALSVAGLFAVATAAWGRIEAPALLALPLVLGFSLLFGFVNYHLAVALALLVLALWIRTPALGGVWRWLVFVPLAALVWLAHMAGWAVLLVMVAGWELATRRNILAAGLRLLPLTLPALPTLLWRSEKSVSVAPVWGNKLQLLGITLRGEWQLVDLAAVGVLMLAGYWLLRTPGVRRSAGLLLAAAGLFLCFLALPRTVFSSDFADQRLLVPMGMLFFLGFAITDARQQRLVAGIGLALFALRIGEISIGWYQRGTAAVADLAVLDHVERGARIAVMAPQSNCGAWPMTGFEHLPSMAIIRREAFVNTQWDMPGSQLMRPIYNRGGDFNGVYSALLLAPGCLAGRSLDVLLHRLPRGRFDYAWVFGPQRPEVPWLQPIAHGPNSTLYRITPPG